MVSSFYSEVVLLDDQENQRVITNYTYNQQTEIITRKVNEKLTREVSICLN